MLDPADLIDHWGYLALFLFVILGNMGLPLPEETILILAGYMVWRGKFQLAVVVTVAVIGAAAGDNLGYWLGRRYGRAALRRHAIWTAGRVERLEAMRAFVERRGALAVFVARFVPGLRFAAGPLAGALGLRFLPFLAANLLGAAIYVPLTVGAGYAIGYGLGGYVERLRLLVGEVEYLVLAAALVGAAGLLGWRALKGVRGRPGA